MLVFLSYAREQGETAALLAARLRADGFRVFYDRRSIQAGAAFDSTVRRKIRTCHGFVFLISPDAVARGYALTELGFAEDRWRNPAGHVLPVLAAPTPHADIPAYLRSINLFQPKGDLVAEVTDALDKWRAARRRRTLGRVGAGAFAAMLAGAATAAALRVQAEGPSITELPPAVARIDASARANDLPASERQPPQPAEVAPPRKPPKPSNPALLLARRHFPDTTRCKVELEREGDGGPWWLVCSCPTGVEGDESLRVSGLSTVDLDSRWEDAAVAAERGKWRCP